MKVKVSATIVLGQPIPNWKPTGKMYHWPDVVVKFPNGEVWDRHGGVDADGNVIDGNPQQITLGGSPCQVAMENAGIELVEVSSTPLTVELAVKGAHGEWELLGDFDSIEAAKASAYAYASLGQHHIDDYGVMAFGISSDPASGHYELDFCVDTETGESW